MLVVDGRLRRLGADGLLLDEGGVVGLGRRPPEPIVKLVDQGVGLASSFTVL